MSNRRRIGRALAVIGAASLSLLVPSAPKAVGPPCVEGRFLIQGGPLVQTGGGGAVVLQGKRVSIDTLCPSVSAVVKATKTGTRVSAAWRACVGSLPGKARLKAKVGLDCGAMTGRFVAPKAKVMKVFNAARSTCGDERIDDDGGEDCEEEGCPLGLHCDACHCVPDDGTATVSFSAQVQPILAATCATVSCHTGSLPQQGLDLSPGKAFAAIVNVTSIECPGNKLVLPGSLGESYLIRKLHGPGGSCFAGARMPQIGELKDHDLATIATWIVQGAQNN